MGLDAVVYTNLKNLGSTAGIEELSVDSHTGEAFFLDDDVARRYPADIFKAIERRLGNVAVLGKILAEVSQISPPDSILRRRILKSFSHSGDTICCEELEALEQEVHLIKKKTEGVRSLDLTEFLNVLEELVTTAKEQENPIVFV